MCWKYTFQGGRECSVQVMQVEKRTVCVVRGVRDINKCACSVKSIVSDYKDITTPNTSHYKLLQITTNRDGDPDTGRRYRSRTL